MLLLDILGIRIPGVMSLMVQVRNPSSRRRFLLIGGCRRPSVTCKV